VNNGTKRFDIHLDESVSTLLGIHNHELQQINIHIRGQAIIQDEMAHYSNVNIELDTIEVTHEERSDVYSFNEKQLKHFLKIYYKDEIESETNDLRNM
jgi:hypothetical protein